MDTQSLANVLGKLRFSEVLPDDVVQRVAALATLRGYPSGTYLFREGTDNDQLMVISIGRVALDMNVPGRGNVRIMSLGPGDIVAWSALVGDGRMTTSAVALEDTQVVTIRAGDVLALCQSDAVVRLSSHAAVWRRPWPAGWWPRGCNCSTCSPIPCRSVPQGPD